VAFEALREAAVAGDIASLVKGALPVKAPPRHEATHKLLNTVQTLMQNAVTRETSGQAADAIATWGILFGDGFPS
jgi:hypothetical protein